MRHKRKGRRLGRSSSHRRALLRNLASSLILTERDAELDNNAPKTKGRIVTTVQKAKEVRPLVEKCITIARKALPHLEESEQYGTDAQRYYDEEGYRRWRHSERWQKWSNARAPALAARRRCLQMLGNKEAVKILFDEIAPRFADRDGGYTRILRLPERRLGDAGEQALLEFVGRSDRVVERAERPAFDDDNGAAAKESQAQQPQTETAEEQETAPEEAPAGQGEETGSQAQQESGEMSTSEEKETSEEEESKS